MLEKNNAEMIQEIKDVILSSRKKIAYEVNNTMLLHIGMSEELLLKMNRMVILKQNMGNKL